MTRGMTFPFLVQMESVLVQHDSILETVKIGVPEDVKGDTTICFVPYFITPDARCFYFIS